LGTALEVAVKVAVPATPLLSKAVIVVVPGLKVVASPGVPGVLKSAELAALDIHVT
jgi:hypothetical protein